MRGTEPPRRMLIVPPIPPGRSLTLWGDRILVGAFRHMPPRAAAPRVAFCAADAIQRVARRGTEQRGVGGRRTVGELARGEKGRRLFVLAAKIGGDSGG